MQVDSNGNLYLASGDGVQVRFNSSFFSVHTNLHYVHRSSARTASFLARFS